MADNKIQETKSGGVQLSNSAFFLMTAKFKIGKGSNKGKAIYVIKINHLVTDPEDSKKSKFEEIKGFLLSSKEYEEYIALQIQLSEKKLPE
jgi:hypothetical protein